MVHLQFLTSFLGQEAGFAEVAVDVLGEFLYDVIVHERVHVYVFRISLVGIRHVGTLESHLEILEIFLDISLLRRRRLFRITEHHGHGHRRPEAYWFVHLLLNLEVIAASDSLTGIVIRPYYSDVHPVLAHFLVVTQEIDAAVFVVEIQFHVMEDRSP